MVLISRTRYTVASCVSWDGAPSGVSLGLLRVDGLDASSIIPYLALRASRGRPCAVLLDSVTIAGFNVASPGAISRLAGAPVIIVYNYRPSRERLEAGLRRLGDGGARSRAISIVDSAVEVDTRQGRVYIVAWGVDLEAARDIVEECQVHSRTPEPVRMAHKIASEMSRLLIGGYKVFRPRSRGL